MKRWKPIVLAGVLAVSFPVVAQHDHAHDHAAHDRAAQGTTDHEDHAAGHDQDDMEVLMTRLATPGEHHGHLAKLEGTWDARMKIWMDPSQPAMESIAVARNKMILGGRYLHMDFETQFMGQPFTGVGVEGFDNATGRHVGTWFDSSSTSIARFEGSCSDGGKVLETTSKNLEPATGKMKTMKTKTTIVDEDHYRWEAWNEGESGQFYKSMEITYTRRS